MNRLEKIGDGSRDESREGLKGEFEEMITEAVIKSPPISLLVVLDEDKLPRYYTNGASGEIDICQIRSIEGFGLGVGSDTPTPIISDVNEWTASIKDSPPTDLKSFVERFILNNMKG